jgi:hypothetical protein
VASTAAAVIIVVIVVFLNRTSLNSGNDNTGRVLPSLRAPSARSARFLTFDLGKRIVPNPLFFRPEEEESA